jgi:hypothetical protein
MAVHRATFTVTADATGYGATDASLKLPVQLTRHAFLEAVVVDTTDASGAASVTLRQIDTDDDDVDTPGDILLYADQVQTEPGFPRVAYVDDAGVAISGSDGGRVLIRAKRVTVEVDGAVSGDIFVVYVYYETQGDLRF